MADIGGDGRPADPHQVPVVFTRPADAALDVARSRARILLDADADRRAIERAMHDGLQQHLVALAAGLRQVQGLVVEDPMGAEASLHELAALAREAIDEAGRLAQLIHPPRLHDPAALPGALRAVAARTGVTVTIDVATEAVHSPQTWIALYWSCRDALSLAPPGTHATVKVRDRDGGVGFEVEVADSYAEGRSERLRDRVEALGGCLTVDVTEAGSRMAGVVPSP